MKTARIDKRDKAPQPRRRPGLIPLFGKKIWVSELTSIIFVCALSVALLSISAVILRNELAINDLDRAIAELKTEKISMTHNMETMREKQRVIMLLNEVARKKIKPAALNSLANLIYDNSRQFGYNPELLLAVMAVESRFDPKALGRYRSGTLSGALGLMQIKYETALEVAKTLGMEKLRQEDLMDPEINMLLGTAYLTMLISRFKSFKLGIIAYNLGPGAVRGSLSRREQLPMRYYEKVLAQYYRLKELGDELERAEILSSFY